MANVATGVWEKLRSLLRQTSDFARSKKLFPRPHLRGLPRSYELDCLYRNLENIRTLILTTALCRLEEDRKEYRLFERSFWIVSSVNMIITSGKTPLVSKKPVHSIDDEGSEKSRFLWPDLRRS